MGKTEKSEADMFSEQTSSGFWKGLLNRLFRSKKDKIDILDIVNDLLALKTPPAQTTIKTINDLVKVHRVVENTKARKSLEKWAKKVIVWYLIIVLMLFVARYNTRYYLLYFSDKVMITILATTTATIIGMGLIVLRGYFLVRDIDKKNKKENDEDDI